MKSDFVFKGEASYIISDLNFTNKQGQYFLANNKKSNSQMSTFNHTAIKISLFDTRSVHLDHWISNLMFWVGLKSNFVSILFFT